MVVALLGLSLAACGGDSNDGNSDVKKVGILKYVTAPALDDAEAGIIEALEKAGFEIVEIFDDMTEKPLNEKSQRAIYVTKKVK